MRPIIYHSNLYSLGTLSGSHGTNTNLVERIADGSVNIGYETTRVGQSVGVIISVLPAATRPDALVIVRADGLAGEQFILYSEDVGGGNLDVELNFLLGSTLPHVEELPAGTDKQQWRLGVFGPSASTFIYEMQLATKYQVGRSPDLLVTRTKVRQFSRATVAGGQPFVKRDGPGLRRTLCTFTLVSGAEVTAAEAFIDAVDGGQAFTLTDDRGETYWAELLDGDVAFRDTAGVFAVSMTFQEISAEL